MLIHRAALASEETRQPIPCNIISNMTSYPEEAATDKGTCKTLPGPSAFSGMPEITKQGLLIACLGVKIKQLPLEFKKGHNPNSHALIPLP